VAAGMTAYVGWVLHGLAPVLAQLLGTERATHWPLSARGGTLIFLTVELLLAAGVMWLALPWNPKAALRILLLPALAHAVVLLRWPGIAAVALACAGLYGALLMEPPRGGGPVSFIIEGIFTVVCLHMVVASEKSRAEVERMAEALAEANRHLAAQAVQTEELSAARERNRMAREIHDSLGHYLTVVRVQLEAALALHERSPAQACEAVAKAHALAGDGLGEIRQSIASLRAAPLENRTLCEALLALLAECEAAGQRVKMEVRGTERALSPAAGLTLYRAAQEGLTNVRKHARGAAAHLLVDFTAAPPVRLTLHDDGPGADDATTAAGVRFGLAGLRERAALLGGTLNTRTAPGAGFTLTMELPE
jgi:signal transduction histidine kinase